MGVHGLRCGEGAAGEVCGGGCTSAKCVGALVCGLELVRCGAGACGPACWCVRCATLDCWEGVLTCTVARRPSPPSPLAPARPPAPLPTLPLATRTSLPILRPPCPPSPHSLTAHLHITCGRHPSYARTRRALGSPDAQGMGRGRPFLPSVASPRSFISPSSPRSCRLPARPMSAIAPSLNSEFLPNLT